MRKLSLLLLALLVVSGAAFAQVTITPTIEVEASATFGVQLDEMTTGIKNAAEATLGFVFTEEQTQEFGEGDVYGWIELEDFGIEIDSSGDDQTNKGAVEVSVGSVTGKVFFGPAYLSLDEATVSANEAEAFSLIDQWLVSYAPNTGPADIGTKAAVEYPGVALGFVVPDVATIELGVASKYDWNQTSTSVSTAVDYATWLTISPSDLNSDGDIDEADYALYVSSVTTTIKSGANDNNAYVMSIDAEITAIDMVTIALVSTMEFGTPTTDKNNKFLAGTPGTQGNPAGIGLSVQYDMPMGDMTFSPVFGADFVFEQDGNEDLLTSMEFGLGTKLSWAALGLDEDEDDHIDFIGNAKDEEEVTSGAYLGAVYGIHPQNKDENINTLGVRLGVFEDSGDDGLLPVVGGALMFDYVSTLKNDKVAGFAETRSDLGIGAELNADLGVVSPYFGIKVLMLDVEGKTLVNPTTFKTESRGITTINIGTDINVISNTTFTIDYASGNLLYNDEYYGGADPTYGPTYGNITSSTAKLGVLTIATSVEF